jgi:hypothetical protein
VDNFANASFPPDLIAVMQDALQGAISTLPHPSQFKPCSIARRNDPAKCQ